MSHSLWFLFPKLNQFFSRQVDGHTLHISGLCFLCFDNTINVELAKRDFFIEEIAEVAIVTGIFIARLEHLLLAHFTSVLHAEGVQASDLLVVKSQLASAILHTKFDKLLFRCWKIEFFSWSCIDISQNIIFNDYGKLLPLNSYENVLRRRVCNLIAAAHSHT